MDISVLKNLSVLLGCALIIALLFRAIRFPGIIGFILAGIVLGPEGLGLFSVDWVPFFVDACAIFLLFIVGLELNQNLFFRVGKTSLLAGFSQVFGSLIFFIGTIYILFHSTLTITEVIVTSFALTLTSSALIIRHLQEKGELETSYGLVTTAILIIQDIITIAFLILISISRFSPSSLHNTQSEILHLALGFIIFCVLLLSRRIITPVIHFIANRGGRDLLTLFGLFSAVVGALIAIQLDWPAGLGACCAGLILGQSDERNQFIAEVQPFQDVIYTLFFLSLGMSFPLAWVLTHFHYILPLFIGLWLIRFILHSAIFKLIKLPFRIALLVAIYLLPLSEFSYIICVELTKLGLLSIPVMNAITSLTILTMIAGSINLHYMETINQGVAKLFPKWSKDKNLESEGQEEKIVPHVVIIGFGLTGENLARVLKSTGIPFIVIEMNQELAEKAKSYQPLRLIVGDATQSTILKKSGLDTAQAVVVAVNDPIACRKIVGQIATYYPQLYILVRTRFAQEIEVLRKLGAKQVIPEDFETSIEVIAHVLRRCGVPDNIVEAEVIAIRVDGYAMLRGKASSRAGIEELIRILERTTTQTYYLAENSIAVGKTLAELDLRKRTGCSVIAVVRAGHPTPSPPGDFVLQPNDILVLVGAHAQIESARKILDEARPPLTP